MAKKRLRGDGPNQSQFIRDLFAANPQTKLGDAKKAWSDAGHKGAIGNSLFYVVKRKAQMTRVPTGTKRGRPVGSTNKPKATADAASYEAVEDRLDDVIRMLWTLGDHGLVAELRTARRKVAAKLV
jgi:hypothetical protein